MEELDFDNMTDEQVEQVLYDIQHGKYDNATSATSDEQEDEEDGYKDNNDEDTEGNDSDEESAGTNDDHDGENQDTEDEEEDENSENTPVDQDNEENEEQDASTDGTDDGGSKENVGIDAKEFERYKKFYDQVANVEFIANGKKVKGFTDPEKIKQAQQMAYGFGDKMAAFKQYRPFMSTLKERGILENPEKFNFAMDLLDGDQEALKAHMKSLNMDPLDLDMDTVSYAGKNHVASNESLVLEDVIEQARGYGVEDKLRDTIGKQWDQESFNEFLTVPDVRRDLLEHMATGAFDLVQDRIAEMKTLDVSGSFNSMKSTDQYRQAVQSLTADAQRMSYNNAANSSVNSNGGNIKEATKQAIKPTANREAEQVARQEAEYKRNLETKNRLADEARKKAVSVSKKKVSTTENKKFDPLALEGKELDDFVDSLIRA